VNDHRSVRVVEKRCRLDADALRELSRVSMATGSPLTSDQAGIGACPAIGWTPFWRTGVPLTPTHFSSGSTPCANSVLRLRVTLCTWCTLKAAGHARSPCCSPTGGPGHSWSTSQSSLSSLTQHPQARLLAADIHRQVELQFLSRPRIGIKTQHPQRLEVRPLDLTQLREEVLDARSLGHRHDTSVPLTDRTAGGSRPQSHRPADADELARGRLTAKADCDERSAGGCRRLERDRAVALVRALGRIRSEAVVSRVPAGRVSCRMFMFSRLASGWLPPRKATSPATPPTAAPKLDPTYARSFPPSRSGPRLAL
jgi:hypothetical protein